jgi:hypothetical protein
MGLAIDYGCEERKEDGDLKGNIGAIKQVLTLPFRKSPPKNKTFIQEMHLKIPLLGLGLKLSNSKPGCRVSALHCFVKQIPAMACHHQ